MPSRQINSKLLALLGAAYIVIAAVLTIRELELPFGYSIAAVLAALAALAPRIRGQIQSGVLLAFAVLGLSTPIVFFVSERQPSMLAAIGASCGGSAYLIWRQREQWFQFDWADLDKKLANRQSIFIWASMIVSSLASLWALYFWFLAPLGDLFLARRLIFTLFIVSIGLVLAVRGRQSRLPFMRMTALSYLGAGALKAALYDTTHLTGILRIGVFAGCGALFLIGAKFVRRKEEAV